MSDAHDRFATIGIEQIIRPAPMKTSDLVPRPDDADMATTATIRNEVIYRAHIFPAIVRQGDHHGEGKTPAQALVNAALHWERHGG